MSGINVEWAIGELDKFILLTMLKDGSGSWGVRSTVASDTEVIKQAQVIEKILDRVVPLWRIQIELRMSNRWTRMPRLRFALRKS